MKLVKSLVLCSILTLLANAAAAIPYTGADIELLGVQTSDRSTNQTNQWREDGTGIVYTLGGLDPWIEYTTYLDVGVWNIGLNVTNRGNLGIENWYPFFEIGVNESPYYSLNITASDVETHFGFITTEILAAGEFTVRYSWLNDEYDPSVVPSLDANLQIDSVFFDRVTGAPVPEPATVFLLGIGLTGIVGFRFQQNRK